MNLLTETFEWMLPPSCPGQDESSGNYKSKGYAQIDSWKQELGIDLTETTDTCSETSFESTDSSFYESKVQSPVREIKKSPPRRSLVAQTKPTAADDDDDLPVLSTKRSRKLPGTWYYSSNHIMVNTERTKRNVHPLTRKNYLDAAARWHAELMTEKDELFHANPADLKQEIGKPHRVLGTNVFRGDSIRAIHNQMMESPADVSNMLDDRYIDFGMATARSPRGDLLLVQLFIG